ncbi:cytochrome C oxidase subunit I [Undibacterium sp. CY18W]|uniref:Cytochrome C oxidase subunit I n=1 Tax=Undibacterium hunanense TaxID=2762292 RepID=A0ABR6ZRP0_9BURK|nr:cytochrome C oxidase subunit I [Undibacterium hunanense]MBC3918513.1 cytochrome C oxidase subunit I [Undibacterium hunanense]
MDKQTSRGRWKLLMVLAVCAAPMIFSYLAYYVIKPSGRTNYGSILDPRNYPMPKIAGRPLGASATDPVVGLDAYKGKWIMLQVDSGACAEACQKRMYDIRQLRVAQGKEMDRIERVWLITDDVAIDTALIRQFDGARMLKVDPAVLKAWLPTESSTQISDHIYMIDPIGNLMMRFPKDADPNKIKKDLSKLLRASAIG